MPLTPAQRALVDNYEERCRSQRRLPDAPKTQPDLSPVVREDVKAAAQADSKPRPERS